MPIDKINNLNEATDLNNDIKLKVEVTRKGVQNILKLSFTSKIRLLLSMVIIALPLTLSSKQKTNNNPIIKIIHTGDSNTRNTFEDVVETFSALDDTLTAPKGETSDYPIGEIPIGTEIEIVYQANPVIIDNTDVVLEGISSQFAFPVSFTITNTTTGEEISIDKNSLAHNNPPEVEEITPEANGIVEIDLNDENAANIVMNFDQAVYKIQINRESIKEGTNTVILPEAIYGLDNLPIGKPTNTIEYGSYIIAVKNFLWGNLNNPHGETEETETTVMYIPTTDQPVIMHQNENIVYSINSIGVFSPELAVNLYDNFNVRRATYQIFISNNDNNEEISIPPQYIRINPFSIVTIGQTIQIENANTLRLVIESSSNKTDEEEYIIQIEENSNMADSDMEPISKLTISPNPSIGLFNIEFTLTKSQYVEFGIYNVKGQLVKQITGKFNAGTHTEPCDITSSSNAQYFLHTYINGENKTIKLIKIN